jgi:DNA-binding CsgD family transcriptional regulator
MRKLTAGRNDLIAKRFKKGASEEELATEYDIGLTYVRTILRERGLIEKKSREDLSERNERVKQLHGAGKPPEEIAAEMELTTTRIRQILHEDTSGVARQEALLELREKALELIAQGKSAKEIEDQIGLQTVKRLKYRFNFNVFKLVVNRKAARAVELYNGGMKPADISEKLGCTRDYVYMLLREAGLELKISKDAKRERDKDIYAYIKKGKTTAEAAEKWDLSEAMVKIIHEKVGRQDKTATVFHWERKLP